MRYRLLQGTLLLNTKQLQAGDIFEADKIPSAFSDCVEMVEEDTQETQETDVKKGKNVASRSK